MFIFVFINPILMVKAPLFGFGFLVLTGYRRAVVWMLSSSMP